MADVDANAPDPVPESLADTSVEAESAATTTEAADNSTEDAGQPVASRSRTSIAASKADEDNSDALQAAGDRQQPNTKNVMSSASKEELADSTTLPGSIPDDNAQDPDADRQSIVGNGDHKSTVGSGRIDIPDDPPSGKPIVQSLSVPALPLNQDQIQARADAARRAFRIFDTDHQTYLGPEAVRHMLHLVGADNEDLHVIALGDSLGMVDGRISEEQFMKAMDRHIRGRKVRDEDKQVSVVCEAIISGEVDRLKEAFDACDSDHSGEIDKTELKVVLAALGEQNLSQKQVNKMFVELKGADADEEAGITFDEFIAYMCERKGHQRKHKSKMDKFFNIDILSSVSSFMADTDNPITDQESKETMSKMPFLERIGANFMKEHYRGKASKKPEHAVGKTEFHVLTKDERRAMKKVEYIALTLDTLLGALSAVLAGIAEAIADGEWHTDGISNRDGSDSDPYTGSESGTNRILYFWLIVGTISIAATIAEVICIYYIHLRAAVRISSIAGLKLFPVDKERAFVTAALARAALELPNPRERDMGVDPLEEASKARLFIATLVYKAKTGLTTFIIRILVKRVLARVAVKSFLHFIAVPVQMFWNALIGYKCLRATRTIALGPSVAIEIWDGLHRRKLARDGPLAFKTKECIMRAIAVAIVAMEEMHPNLRILLARASDVLNMHLDRQDLIDEVAAGKSNENLAATLSRKNSQMKFTVIPTIPEKRLMASKSGPLARAVDTAASNSALRKSQSVASPSQGKEPLRMTKVDSDMDLTTMAQMEAESHPPPPLHADDYAITINDKQVDEAADGKESADAEQDEIPSTLTVPAHKADAHHRRRGSIAVDTPGRPQDFFRLMATLEELEQLHVLHIFCLACVLNGFVPSHLIKHYCRAAIVAGQEHDEWPLRWLTFMFLRGELVIEHVMELFTEDFREQMTIGACKTRVMHCTDRCLVCMAI